jgi:CDP-glycerol glycerophosphotransferase (TagB/SpsB family)
VTWENEKLDTLLQQSDVLVSAASSACFEALAMGVPVIIQGSRTGITFVPIPQAVPEGRWQICYAADELLTAIETIQQRRSEGLDNNRDTAHLLQVNYLEPVSRQGVRRLVLGGDDP